MNLIQLQHQGQLFTAYVDTNKQCLQLTNKPAPLYQWIRDAIQSKKTLQALLQANLGEQRITFSDYQDNYQAYLPVTHPNAKHTIIGGTGLTHANRAKLRVLSEINNPLHDTACLSDSERVYMSGVTNGKPENILQGAKPEWFYKGDISILKPSQTPVTVPAHDLGIGEEAELIAVYYISDELSSYRIGYCLGNEFCDHKLEESNFFYISQSKLRECSIGAEIIIGNHELDVVNGHVRIIRDDNIIWNKPFASGQKRMNFSMENLEHHVFQHTALRRPDSFYFHFLGADQISHSDDIRLQHDDEIVIEAEPFQFPLVNRLQFESEQRVYRTELL